MPDPADLAAVEIRLRQILGRYADRLEPGSLYGIETLTRAGAGAHDFFAGLKAGSRYVSLYLKPVYTWPQLAGGMSPGLHRRMQGKSCFKFTSVDEGMFAELEALIERSFTAYQSGGTAFD
jgi:hypothetical protein